MKSVDPEKLAEAVRLLKEELSGEPPEVHECVARGRERAGEEELERWPSTTS